MSVYIHVFVKKKEQYQFFWSKESTFSRAMDKHCTCSTVASKPVLRMHARNYHVRKVYKYASIFTESMHIISVFFFLNLS